jgi:hypothetical protein
MSMFSRRTFMLASAAAAAAGGRALAATGTGSKKAEFLVVVLAEGGWDVTFCFDNKLSVSGIDSPDVDMDPGESEDQETTATYGGITIVENKFKRPFVSDFFEKWHDVTSVVNGLWMGSIAHDPCRYRILTGTQDGTRPDMTTIVGHTHGDALPLGSVDLSGWSLNGPLAASSGRIGANSQLLPLVDTSVLFVPDVSIGRPYPIWRSDLADPGNVDLDSFLVARNEAMKARLGGDMVNGQRLNDLGMSIERAARFRTEGGDIIGSLSLGSVASLNTQTDMAASLLADGLCRSVTIDSRKDWDTHDMNVAQHGHFDALFLGLDTLLQSLETRGILDRTLVCVLSEMTRTPRINGAAGKDHWGHTSALMIGAGVRGSTQVGGTDDNLESLAVDYNTGAVDDNGELNKYENLSAGILELLDVDPEEWLPGVEPYRGFKT